MAKTFLFQKGREMPDQVLDTSVPLDEYEEDKPFKALNRLKKTNARLREMEKLRSDLVHMIIHDLKGPLSEIVANLDLLEDDTISPSQREYLSSANIGAQELHRMIQNILEIYQIEEKKKVVRPAFFDPLEAIERVKRGLAARQSMKEISISIRSQTDSHKLFADRDLFERVILNLLANAIDHTPPETGVDVHVSWDQDFGRLYVSVSDRGPGIRKRDRRRIFQKFFSANQGGTSRHTGLGLPFCKLAVEAHGGEIWVEDRNGLGSRFLFYIPNNPNLYPERTRRI